MFGCTSARNWYLFLFHCRLVVDDHPSSHHPGERRRAIQRGHPAERHRMEKGPSYRLRGRTHRIQTEEEGICTTIGVEGRRRCPPEWKGRGGWRSYTLRPSPSSRDTVVVSPRRRCCLVNRVAGVADVGPQSPSAQAPGAAGYGGGGGREERRRRRRPGVEGVPPCFWLAPPWWKRREAAGGCEREMRWEPLPMNTEGKSSELRERVWLKANTELGIG